MTRTRNEAQGGYAAAYINSNAEAILITALIELGRGEFHMIRAVRDVAGLIGSDFDLAARELFRSQRINLVPEDDQRILTEGDWWYGLPLGGEIKHRMIVN